MYLGDTIKLPVLLSEAERFSQCRQLDVGCNGRSPLTPPMGHKAQDRRGVYRPLALLRGSIDSQPPACTRLISGLVFRTLDSTSSGRLQPFATSPRLLPGTLAAVLVSGSATLGAYALPLPCSGSLNSIESSCLVRSSWPTMSVHVGIGCSCSAPTRSALLLRLWRI
jgi:hypothetical protein